MNQPTNMKINSFIVIFDTETTGLVAGVDKMIEFAAIVYNKKREIVKSIQIYIDPGKEVPYEAFKVHGMDRKFLLEHGAVPFAEAWPKIEKFIEEAKGGLWVAHNASFDLTMMQSEIDEMNGRQWVKKEAGKLPEGQEDVIFEEILAKYAPSGQCEILDSMLLAKRVEYGLPDNDPDYVDLTLEGVDPENPKAKTNRNRFTMDYIAKRFGIDLSARSEGHEALIDCEILGNIYHKLLEVDKKHGGKFVKVHELKLSSRNDGDREVIKRTAPIMKW